MKRKAKTPSKTRKRATLRTKPKQQVKELYDYMLLMTPRFNERKNRIVTYVALRTVKEFSNFRYELVADTYTKDHTIHIDIKGLKAPELTFPDLGSALFETELEDLHGTYDLVVRKLRKEENVFRVKISPEKVVVVEKPEKQFIDLITQKEQW